MNNKSEPKSLAERLREHCKQKKATNLSFTVEQAIRDVAAIKAARRAPLPEATPWHERGWRPQAFTTIPITRVVAAALVTGALARRLWRGLERIYVHEWAWLRSPRLEAPLRSLAEQLPERLILVPIDEMTLCSMRDGEIDRLMPFLEGREHTYIGLDLYGRYKEDFEAAAWMPEVCLRVGPWPRRGSLWIHEYPVSVNDWVALDEGGLRRCDEAMRQKMAEQEARALEALGAALKGARDGQDKDE